MNQGWAQFTGRPVGEELDRGWRDRLHPEDELRYRETVARGGEGREGWEVEFRLQRSDGAYHWLLERAVPIGAGKSFAGYVGSCTDINARFLETERQTLLAEVGAALDLETGVDGAADGSGPADREEPAGRVLRRRRWSATTAGSGPPGWRGPTPRPRTPSPRWTRTAGWHRPRWRPGGRCSPRNCPTTT